MIKIVATLLIISAVLGWMYWQHNEPIPDHIRDFLTLSPHHARFSDVGIEHIHIRAVYFVPVDKIPVENAEWSVPLVDIFDELKEFHLLQLQESSSLSYEIIESPIAGSKYADTYLHGMSHYSADRDLGLLREELGAKLPLSNAPDGAYDVLLVIYEGQGAAGGGNISVLSREFLGNPEYKDIRATILAHEFYHALGLPDEYDISRAVYGDSYVLPRSIGRSYDIMGFGITKPLSHTYIKRSSLHSFGL